MYRKTSRGTDKTEPEILDLFKAETIKDKHDKRKKSSLLTKPLKMAAKELRKHPDIIVKKVDKTNIIVVLNKSDYDTKLKSVTLKNIF